ncbi:MAG TPA: cytochrome c oxidase subunit II [Actinomycetota bacterium]|nr:cytochrome c oxidase subunit II [Actinomycetota bacterium]
MLGACTGSPSTLDAQGPGAARIANLWWVMFGISVVVIAVVSGLLAAAILRRRRRQLDPDAEPRWGLRLILWGGAILPVVVLTAMWVLTLRDLRAISEPISRGEVTIEVIGHRWWWEVRYPSLGIVTANDVHIPVGRPVTVRLQTIDVIHSFWVPQLTGKTDMIPGRTNSMSIQADRSGVYRGQCAEFCGLQHANMAFFVVADEPAAFQAWATREAGPAPAPTDPRARLGLQVFLQQPCVACHAIRGTDATGAIGPDLTHFGSRLSIGAGTVPNERGFLGGWIENSQALKPGNLMPPMRLDAEDLDGLLAYLESLT